MLGLIPLIPNDRFDRNNALFVFLMGALPTVAGSAVSFLMGAAFVWGLICIFLGQFPVSLTRMDRMLAWTFTGFVFVVLGTALIGESPWRGIVKSAGLLPFLSVWIVVPRLRATRNVDYLSWFCCGAAIGAIAGMLLGFFQAYLIGIRPEGGAGNPGVYSILSLALAAFAALNIKSDAAATRWLAFAGLLAGLVSVVISISRGVWLAAIPVMVLILLYAPQSWSRFSWRTISATLVGAGLAIFVFAGHVLTSGYSNTIWSFHALIEGSYASSMGERLQLWSASLKAIAESPWWGYGIQNRMAVIAGYLPVESEGAGVYTHVHNGFLNAMVDGGVFVLVFLIAILAAPILLAGRAPCDKDHRKRLFLATSLSLVYALCGMTQIMYKHDIMDSFYVFCATLVAASIPKLGSTTEVR